MADPGPLFNFWLKLMRQDIAGLPEGGCTVLSCGAILKLLEA